MSIMQRLHKKLDQTWNTSPRAGVSFTGVQTAPCPDLRRSGIPTHRVLKNSSLHSYVAMGEAWRQRIEVIQL